MGGADGPHGLSLQKPFDQPTEAGGADLGKALALPDQAREQPSGGLAFWSRPQPAGNSGAVGGEDLHRLGQAPGRLGGRGGRAGIGIRGGRQRISQGDEQGAGVVQGLQQLRRCQCPVLAGPPGGRETRLDPVGVSPSGPPQAMSLQRPPRGVQLLERAAEANKRMLEDGQQQHGIVGIGHRLGDQRRQHPHRRVGQGRAGRGVGLDSPTRKPRRDPPGQGLVGGDQGAGLAGRLQGLAQHQGGQDGGLLLPVGGHQGQALEAFRERIGALASLLAEVLDHCDPIGGGLGGAQGLVD